MGWWQLAHDSRWLAERRTSKNSEAPQAWARWLVQHTVGGIGPRRGWPGAVGSDLGALGGGEIQQTPLGAGGLSPLADRADHGHTGQRTQARQTSARPARRVVPAHFSVTDGVKPVGHAVELGVQLEFPAPGHVPDHALDLPQRLRPAA